MPLTRPKIRTDLIYKPDHESDSHYYVKDPLRGSYLRFNLLQVEMMRALDGKRSFEQIAEILGEEFEIEVSDEQIQRFITRLDRELLLDVTSYKADDARTRRAIRRVLRKRGLSWRVSARDGASHEALLFEQAVHHAREGDPCVAANYFQAVLEANPDNQRARDSLTCIHEAFFKARRNHAQYLSMRHLWNPDRFLAALDARIGRFVFSPWGIVVLFALILSAIPSIVSVMSRPTVFSDFSAADVVLSLALIAPGIIIHEMGHGLTCKHYGGTVDDMGVMLFYGVVPAAYCDVSDSYFFAKRRHKVAVSLAGVPAALLFQAMLWHVCAFTDASFPGRDAILISLFSGMWVNFQNLIPLIPLDGYYALVDTLDITNLRNRSFGYVKRILQTYVLGVPSDEPEPTARERRIFLTFGILAGLYTIAFIYGIWISFLLPLAVEHLGAIGLVVTVIYFANLLGRLGLRYMARFVRYLYIERKAIFTRRRSIAFAAAALTITAILAAPWPTRVDGVMTVEPARRVSIRATAVAGVVSEVKVEEGDRVEAGQVIAVLRSDEVIRDHAVAVQNLKVARLTLEQLRRGARPEEVAMAAAQVRANRVVLASARETLRRARRLGQSGAITREEIHDAHEAAAAARGQKNISTAEAASVRAGARVEALAAATANVQQWEARVEKLASQLAAGTLRSPIAGIVVGNDVKNRVGQWLNRGEALCEVHDLSRWHARIVPDRGEPLGLLRAGQPLTLAASGYPHDQIETEVAEILAASQDSDGAISLRTENLPSVGWRSGMSGHARIYGPSRSVAYTVVVVPLIQIVGFDLWRRLWG